MFANKILRSCLSLTSRRFISRSANKFESKASESAGKTSISSAGASGEQIFVKREVEPSSFDKFILVWMKKYPKGQVPKRVREEEIYQTKSRARVKAANYMIAISVLFCIGFAWSGKLAARGGDSVQKRNLDWHKQINDEHEPKTKAEASS